MSSRSKYTPTQDMAQDFGHIKISRKAFRSLPEGGDVFWNKPRTFSEWEAWVDMFGSAAYAPHNWSLRSGDVVQIERGETRPFAVRFLARRWGWGKNRVQRFLKTISEMDRAWVQQRTADGDTYLVVNYDRYQGERDGDGTQTGTGPGTEAGQRRDKREASKAGKAGGGERAHALPDDWSPTEKHRELASERGLDVEYEAEKMRDWALSATGSKGLSRNWDARFRNWLRKAEPPKSALRVVKGGRAEVDEKPWWEAEEEKFGRTGS